MANKLEEGVAGLISINKPHTDNIFINFKQFEWRKHPLPLGKYYVYETKNGGGCGKVIGEFRVCENRRYSTKSKVDLKYIPPLVIKLGCVDVDTLYKYGRGKPIYANLLNNIHRYAKPRELSEFLKPCDCKHDREYASYYGLCQTCENTITRPPQSWCRVQEIKL